MRLLFLYRRNILQKLESKLYIIYTVSGVVSFKSGCVLHGTHTNNKKFHYNLDLISFISSTLFGFTNRAITSYRIFVEYCIDLIPLLLVVRLLLFPARNKRDISGKSKWTIVVVGFDVSKHPLLFDRHPTGHRVYVSSTRFFTSTFVLFYTHGVWVACPSGYK